MVRQNAEVVIFDREAYRMRRWRGELFHYCRGVWLAFLSGNRKELQENIKYGSNRYKTFMHTR